VELDFVRIECEVTSESAIQLTARFHDDLRSFEAIFKTSSCITLHKVCLSCSEHESCPYRIIFSQKLSTDPEIVRLHQKPPLPFSLYIRDIDSNLSIETITIGMVVIGTAVIYIEHFYTALLRMVEASVHSVPGSKRSDFRFFSLDYQGFRHEMLHGTSCHESLIILSGQNILHDSVHSDSVRIFLKSPLRLLCNGSIIHLFDFAAFFRSQMRRCSSLCGYYGSGELDIDFVQLSDLAQNVALFDNQIRYSQPQWSKRRNKAGLIGAAECSGLVEPMSALLLLGSCFNAGKGATFGFGFYEMEVM